MKKIFLILVGLILLIVLFSDDENKKVLEKSDTIYSNDDFLVKGDRLLGIDITISSNNNYESAFNLGKDLGMDFTTLSLSWDDIESSKNKFKNENLKIANDYYSLNNTKLVLNLTPIDTTANRLPKYLQGKKLNDKEVIVQFKNLIDYTFFQIKDVELVSVSIGNEIDIYLGDDKEKWKEYEDFFKEIKAYIKIKKPKLKVGTKITFDGLTVKNIEESKSINEISDVIMVTYYPLKSDFTVKDISIISEDFLTLTNMYKKEIQFLETGFPSGKYTKSSEELQSIFIHEIFILWDKHKGRIKILTLNWLHDRPSSELDYFKKYYGLSDKKFVDFLGSLGFIGYNGEKKQSFFTIKNETKIRGW